jgi:hypothetical protein
MTTTSRFTRALLLLAVVLTTVACMSGDLGPPRDPDVRGNLAGTFIWAVAEPTLAIGEVDPDGARGSVDRAAALMDDDRDLAFGITIVAAFDTGEQAEAHADDIREMLEGAAAWYADPANASARVVLEDSERPAPLTPPEEAAMTEHLLDPGTRGVGWGGAPGTADAAVFTLGPILVVTGLKSETQADIDEPRTHPIAHLLAAEGGRVVLEGDRFGEGSITADVSCRPADALSGFALRDEIGDGVATGQFYTRPPWMDPPATDAEALARATYRRWTDGISAAMNEGWAIDIMTRYSQAKTEEEIRAVTRELEQRLTERGLTKVEGKLDAVTLALITEMPDYDDDEARAAWVRDVAERMGSVPLKESEFGPRPAGDDHARLAQTASVRTNVDRLEIGWLMFGRFAAGMPYLAAYLEERGCDDLKIGIVDYDEVRGD